MKHTRRVIAGRSIRWDKQLADQAYADARWVKQTLADYLTAEALQNPDRILMIDNTVNLNARLLHQKSSTLAQSLSARLEVGSVVSFMLPNWHEAAVIYLAATMAGMIAHPILPSLRERDLTFVLEDIGSRMLFIPDIFRDHNYADMLETVVANLPRPPQVVIVRGQARDPHLDFNTLLSKAEQSQLPTVDPESVRMIMYTSGTTGRAKGVMHSHNSIHALITQLQQHWLIQPGDIFLVASPISHIGGSIYAFETPILLGTTAVLMERWDADEAVNALQHYRCTHFAGATPFLSQLLGAAQTAMTNLPDLKVFICGGASVPPSLVREAAAYFKHTRVTRVYGSTEVPVTTVGVVDPYDVDYAAETDGRAGIAHLRLGISDSATADAGEVLAKGPQMLVGYVHPEDETTAFDDQGYYRSGDLGRWVNDDYLVIVGRLKDIIIRYGENIAPKEIEDMLIRHPDIFDLAIVGLPDDRTGERACAVIVPRGNSRPDVDTLRTYLVQLGVAKFKIPEQVEIWEALPKNDAGKVLKNQIRDRLIAGD